MADLLNITMQKEGKTTMKWIIAISHIAITVLLTILIPYISLTLLPISARSSLKIVSYLLILQQLWIHFSWIYYSRQELLNLYSIFIFVCFLFNGVLSFFCIFDFVETYPITVRFPEIDVFNGLSFILLAFSWLHLGALYAARQNKGGMYLLIKRNKTEIDKNTIFIVSILLLSISLPFTVYLDLKRIYLVMAGGYFSTYQIEMKTGWSAIERVIANFSLPAAFFLLAASRDNKVMRRLALLIISENILTYLFIGNRGFASINILVSIWLWHLTMGRINKPFLLIVAILGLSIFPAIGALRNIPGKDRMDFFLWIRSIFELKNPMLLSLTEIGGSLSTLIYTMDLVPSARPFGFGSTYLWSLSTLLPNLFWDLHPAMSASGATWLVKTINPFIALAGGGYGFSVFAEAYLNFGWYGTFISMIPLGFLVGSVTKITRKQTTPARAGFNASFFSMFLWLARGESISVTRQIFWYSMLPIVIMLIFQVFRKRRRYLSLHSQQAMNKTS